MSDWLADYYATKVDERDDEILRLRAENEKLLRRIHLFKNTRNEQVFEKLMKAHEEIVKLRAALKGLIEDHEYMTDTGPDEDNLARAYARAALKETGDE